MGYNYFNATVVDDITGRETLVDIATDNGIITAVMPAGELSRELPGTDLKKNYVIPGMIDFHTHLFSHGSTFGIDADRLLTSGVTYAVDMGSAGWVNYPAMRKCDLDGKKIHLKSFLNISPIGQPGKGINEPLEEGLLSLDNMRTIIERFPEEIAGIKVRISKPIVKAEELTPLKKAVEFGDIFQLPVCVHTTNPPYAADEIVKILRPGDIYSHTYHGSGLGIISETGHVFPEVIKAQENGLIMEVGNGLVNFNFPVAQQAIADGLYPDIISSDATPATFHKNPAMWDLPFVMSKFLNLGVPLHRVIRAVSSVPAKVLGLDSETGIIASGKKANFTICRLENRNVIFRDSMGNEMEGNYVIIPEAIAIDGELMELNYHLP